MRNSLISLAVIVGIAFPPNCAFSDSGLLFETLTGLTQEGKDKVLAAASGLVRAKTHPDQSPNDLGWECLAAIRLIRLNYANSRDRLTNIADGLLVLVVKSNRTGKAIGWSSAASHPPCKPRKELSACEGSDTVYAFQSGLGIACLARAAVILQRPELMAVAKDVMTYWDGLRITEGLCKDCLYFAMSDSATDKNRYVRNMNLFVAFGASELGDATNNDELLSEAKSSVRSDIWERENGNRGYLGKLDPLWSSRPGEADRIENHSASIALLLNIMADTLADRVIDQHALTVWRDWATCNNKRCQTEGCRYWAGNPSLCQATATAAHCAFRFRENVARSNCDEFLSLVPTVNAYGIWAVLQADH